MGKYMKQPKLKQEVSAMEISKSKSKSNSTLGVLTRSKTLALQRLQAQQPNNNSHYWTPNSEEDLQLHIGSGFTGSVQSFLGLEDFGENHLDQRATRESTPCDLIRDVDNISTPGSSTRYPSLTEENQRRRSTILTDIPSTREMDELFANFEQQQQSFFMEKYNFDIINDTPLSGRYEWVEVNL